MSTTADIINSVSRLVTALDELLQTDTVESIVRLVGRFGIGAPVKVGLDALGKALDLILVWLGRLDQVFAIDDMLQSLQPAFEGLTSMGNDDGSAQNPDYATLAPLINAAQAAMRVINKLAAGVHLIFETVIPRQAVISLRESLAHLKETLADLGEQLVNPGKGASKPVPSGGDAAGLLAAGGAA
ncbi:hypothetical protein LZ198_11610 [Myxococcus sp. K15C18031901]|uniref:hypothetical protein n=1 Tax=Myxococcus dinghuensis TaxID=2906761 RepID=UPI0020A7561D|nr:hypothetical protein [Myxococcus dinghuensis]MCP3099516.1 hypothetical protein [Myxococcus dinghuensis]